MSMTRFVNQSFLTLKDFDQGDIAALLQLAAELKLEKTLGNEVQTQIGHKESMKDTARVLGRIYDAIEYRGFSQKNVETLAEYSGVPVYNGLTNEYHPTQVLADFLTMTEHCTKPLKEISFCYVGDTANNVAGSLLVGAAKTGMDVRLCGPEVYRPDEELLQYANAAASGTGAQVTVTDDIATGVNGCDFIYTDVWLSMGEQENLWNQRIHWLIPYQVNTRMMTQTGKSSTCFMHCLPAFHDRNTVAGKQIMDKFGLDGLEVTDEVFESEASIVFDQAENRLHARVTAQHEEVAVTMCDRWALCRFRVLRWTPQLWIRMCWRVRGQIQLSSNSEPDWLVGVRCFICKEGLISDKIVVNYESYK